MSMRRLMMDGRRCTGRLRTGTRRWYECCYKPPPTHPIDVFCALYILDFIFQKILRISKFSQGSSVLQLRSEVARNSLETRNITPGTRRYAYKLSHSIVSRLLIRNCDRKSHFP